jgi:hypothetical protein
LIEIETELETIMTITTQAFSAEITALGLEDLALELDEVGLVVVPPERTGCPQARIDEAVQAILDKAHEMTGGVRFTLDDGPIDPLSFPTPDLTPDQWASVCQMKVYEALMNLTQFQIQKLSQYGRVFRDIAVNPVSVALQNHMMAGRTRLSSVNTFIKWHGDLGYGPFLGLHADQGEVPTPWGATAYTGNSTWCLTDYTKENGALAYVPSSHKEGTAAVPADAVSRALPVETPKGSLIVWHGATWHGAFPKQTPGLRLAIAVYHRHSSVLPQEDVGGQLTDAMIADCEAPDVLATLAGRNDIFPYRDFQSEVIPTLAS